tara:strand:- start:72 stop:308 length:237 start_codon:yes stop_codon:yes gene_type:complete
MKRNNNMNIAKGIRLLIQVVDLQFEVQRLRTELRDLQSLRSFTPKDQSFIDLANLKIGAIQQCYDELDRVKRAADEFI